MSKKKPKQRVVNIAVKDVYAKLQPIVVFGKKKNPKKATVELVRELVEKELNDDKYED